MCLWCAPAIAQPREQDTLEFGRTSAFLGSGARALGMGGAFLARADDATAASWNPAGLSYLRRPEVSLVGVRTGLNVDTQDFGGGFVSRDENRAIEPDFLAAAYPISIGGVYGAVQVSFQRVFSLNGDRTEERAERLFQVTSRGGFDVVSLGTGLKLTRTLRAGFTLNRWYNGQEQRRLRFARLRSDQRLDLRLRGFSANLGLLYSPTESLNFGLVGKTPMRGGRVRLQRVREDILANGSTSWNEWTADDIRLDLPGAVGAGLSWRPHSTLTVSADYTRTFWSRAEIRNLFFIGSTPAGEPAAPPDTGSNVLPFPSLQPAEQQDSEELRVGLEYVLIARRLKVPLRAGYFNERQNFLDLPANLDHQAPRPNPRNQGRAPRYSGFTAGLGILIGPMLLDVAYVHRWGSYEAFVRQVRPDPTSDPIDVPGRVESRLDRVLVSVIYRHGTRP